MSEDEIATAILAILPTMGGDIPGFWHPQNINVIAGKTMGAFNKQYTGRADNALVKAVINRVIAA